MRILIDEEHLAWDQAWHICVSTFAYTNHTVMPEALETWPVELMGRILPRHLQIIFEINSRFLADVAARFPDDPDKLTRVSLIQEVPERRVRMAHLAIVGSHSVNGVAQIHTEILKKDVFRDFHEIFPGRFNNKTNGVTPRRWLRQSNVPLSELISDKIGPDWIVDLDRLRGLADLTSDEEFTTRWREVKNYNKMRLAEFIVKKTGLAINVDTIFDVQVKRIHEYKRQLLNILQVITLYNRLKNNPAMDFTPKTVIFGGKAAPGYWMAKKIIKLINSVAEVVNRDPVVSDRLRVVFMPNYSVSSAEKIIPAADVSEQISMAGTEASGTSNMKFALNGALTIGTLDGANVEIREAVGANNIFIFGMNADEVNDFKRQGYDPWSYYQADHELKTTLDMIREGAFSPKEPDLFRPIVRSLLEEGDRFLVLAEYRSYLECQELIGREYRDRESWTIKSILNTANMGQFSSDNTIRQYAEDVWKVKRINLARNA
jgi:starch phosphorylase